MKNTSYTSLLSIIVLFGALLPASSLAQNRPDTLSYKCFEAFHYTPMGRRWASDTTTLASNRFRLNGKEEQPLPGGLFTMFSNPLVDYGARFFDPATARWLSPDPLSGKYPGIAPYAFCAGDPVNFVDPDGNRPIYSTEGILLGTDDNGLQGDAIIMDAQNFKQGMSPDLAAKYDLGISALSDAALVRFNKSYSSLSQRPDWDGYLTLSEANKWYRNGSGKPLFVSLEKLDLSNLSLEGKTVGQNFLVNMFKDSDNTNDALVHGVITLKMYPDRTVRAFSGTYKFYMKPWTKENFKRNIATIGGEIVAGQGRKYEINIYGSKIIP